MQSFNFQSMVGIAVFKFISQTFEIIFIELTDFDFVELDLSFVVFDDIFNFMFKLVVIFFDELKTLFFISF